MKQEAFFYLISSHKKRPLFVGIFIKKLFLGIFCFVYIFSGGRR